MNSSSPGSAVVARPAAAGRPRRWLPYLGAALLAGLIAFGLWPRPTPVETARAQIGPLRATVNEEGKTRIRQRYLVSAPTAGQLRRIELKAGARVEGGRTLLAVLDPLPATPLDARARFVAEARREGALAQLEKARVAQAFAARELQRVEKLYHEKGVSIQELEAAQWREAAAARDVAAAESQLRQADAELAEVMPTSDADATNGCRAPIEIRAPITGRVLRVFEESARVVPAGHPLLEVGDPTDLEVVVEVLSRDGAAIAPGTPVELEQWGGPTPLLGRVRLVEPAAFTKVSALGVEEQRVNLIADLLTPPEARPGLGDQFRVEARIIVWETNRTLKVPAGALFRRGEDWATLVVAEGRTQLRRVKVGRSSGTETQVLEGLAPDEEVVLYPSDRVREGQRVRRIRP